MNARNVLLVEINEITWTVIDRLCDARGPRFLPNLTKLCRDGAWGAPSALESPPYLDPWVTWVTAHTGVPREIHGATVLEQEVSSSSAKRTWEYAAEAGLSVGVYGSIGAYPPPPVEGFVIPGPFAPGSETHPAHLAPIQELNRRYTQVHTKARAPLGSVDTARLGFELARHGLRPATVAAIVRQLAEECVRPTSRWRRPSLQPLINADLFESLYRRVRPRFATWHTNHAAHYMHHYWRAWDDRGFLAAASPAECARYRAAVPHGYRLCDWLLGRFLRMIDANTVLVVASSMGQQPYVSERHRDGRVVVRIRDIDRLLAIVGRDGVVEVVPTMVPQWNLRVSSVDARAALRDRLKRAERIVDGERKPAFGVVETGATLTLTPRGLSSARARVRYRFPGCPGAREDGYPLAELFAVDTPTPKQGMHHPQGVLLAYGPGIRPGVKIGAATNLDLAPTLLTLLGLPVPEVMRAHGGRVLDELWRAAPSVSARPPRPPAPAARAAPTSTSYSGAAGS